MPPGVDRSDRRAVRTGHREPERAVQVYIIAVGVGVSAALTALDKSYSQASELRDAFGLPVLGAISEVASKDVVAHRRRDFQLLAGGAAALALIGGFYTYFTAMQLPVEANSSGEKIVNGAQFEGEVL